MDWLCAKWRGSIVVRYRKNEWIAAKRTLRVATLLCPGANTLGAKGRGRSKGKNQDTRRIGVQEEIKVPGAVVRNVRAKNAAP